MLIKGREANWATGFVAVLSLALAAPVTGASATVEHQVRLKACGLIAGGIGVDARGVACATARNIVGRARAKAYMPTWSCRWTSPRGNFGRCEGRGTLQGKVIEWYVAD